MNLRFDSYRVRRSVDEMTDEEIDRIYSGPWLSGRSLSISEKRAEMRAVWEDDFAEIEIVDVLEGIARSHEAYFFTGGSALVFEIATGRVVASAAQHELDRCSSRDLWDAIGRAYLASKPPIVQRIVFSQP